MRKLGRCYSKVSGKNQKQHKFVWCEGLLKWVWKCSIISFLYNVGKKSSEPIDHDRIYTSKTLTFTLPSVTTLHISAVTISFTTLHIAVTISLTTLHRAVPIEPKISNPKGSLLESTSLSHSGWYSLWGTPDLFRGRVVLSSGAR